MYNKESKKKFLEDKGELTQREYEKFFNKTKQYEEALNKDISEFTLDEITDMLIQIKPKNDKQSKVYCAIINGYRRFIYNNQDNIFSNIDKNFHYQFV